MKYSVYVLRDDGRWGKLFSHSDCVLVTRVVKAAQAVFADVSIVDQLGHQRRFVA